MSSACALLLATAASGLIAGAGLTTFSAAAVAAALATWLARMPRGRVRHLFANLDPLEPDGAILLEAAREALRHVRQTRQPVLLRLSAFTRTARPLFRLDLNREGDLEVCRDGSRPAALKQPAAWIADHPLPLVLPEARCVTLRLLPSGTAERVRVSPAHTSAPPRGLWNALALAAIAACAFDIGWLLAAALGTAFQTYLLEHHPDRSADQA